jgi:hypothetical protein
MGRDPLPFEVRCGGARLLRDATLTVAFGLCKCLFSTSSEWLQGTVVWCVGLTVDVRYLQAAHACYHCACF